MPYPFFRHPTFAEFRAKLEKEFDCEFKEGPQIQSDKGETDNVTYFERIVDGRPLTYPINVTDGATIVEHELIRSICRRFKLDPAAFEMPLG